MKHRTVWLTCCLILGSGLALASCASHPTHSPDRKPQAPRETRSSAVPKVTGSLAEVECGGEAPPALAKQTWSDSDDVNRIGALVAMLEEHSEEGVTLRAYLRCLAESGAPGEAVKQRK